MNAEYAFVTDDETDFGLYAVRVLTYRTKETAEACRRLRISRGIRCGPVVRIPHPGEHTAAGRLLSLILWPLRWYNRLPRPPHVALFRRRKPKD